MPASTAGFALLYVLMMLTVLAGAGAVVAQRWAEQVGRAKEQQLLRVGDAMAKALADYRASTPSLDKRFPARLEDLVLDPRFGNPRHHLRQLYPDPMTGQADWQVIRDAQGGIVGVHSRSERPTWRRVPQRLNFVDLPAATHVSQWMFTPRMLP
ncbi:type II secretion system protein [Pelomonas sp. Root1444]|uniref:type II secretion system protein n=1 Tax=Pelomonas sp. Root1444 TaxID=1736464 RepID=UPI000B1914C3|nr:type II secretion system protein [Pelomonas sp. Root1444]